MNTRETTGTKVKNTLKGWYQKAFPEEKPAAAPLSPLLTANDTIHPNTPQPEQAGQPLLAYLKPDAKNVTVNKYRNLEDECMRELITKLVVEFNFRQMDAISQGKLCFLTTSFCSTSLPMNSLEEHLVDIRTHLTGSVAAFIYMAIFVDLYLARTNDYLHPYNAHRLIFTSFVVADKFVHEKSDSYLNTWLAKVGNVSLKELNKMEQELCAVLFQWTKEKKTLSGNPDVLDEYDYVHREEPPFDWSLMYEEWHKKYFPKRGLDLMPNTDCQSTTFSIRKKLDITEDPFVIKPVNEVKDNEIKPVDEVKDNEAPVKPKLVEAIARFYAKKMDEDKDKLPFISEFTYFSEGGCPSIEDYLKRFLHLERISVKAFLHMTLMMDTWFRNHSDQPFGIENCYCLMAASLCIAHKFHDGGFDGKNYILYRENKPFEDGAHRVSEFETEARLPPDHLKKLMLLFQTGINNQLRYTADEYRAAEIRFLAPADRNPVLKELAKFEPQTQKPFLEAFHPAVEEPSCPVIFNETPRRPVSFHI